MPWTSPSGIVMGWNQRIAVSYNGSAYYAKAKTFSVGTTQNYDVPKLVTGATDLITWSKGVIEFGGNIETPLTGSLGQDLIKAADKAVLGWNGAGARISVASDIHGGAYECMVNQLTITIREKEPINLSAQLIGRLGLNYHSSTDGEEALVLSDAVGTVGGINPSGGSVGTLSPAPMALEQIAMFDQAVIGPGMNPAGCEYLLPTSVTITINNNLQRNYILGCASGRSSLDTWSISSAQREITAQATFISGLNNALKYIQNAGVDIDDSGTALVAIYGDQAGSNALLDIDSNRFITLWGATPPTLGTERMNVELKCTFLAKEPGLWSIVDGSALN